MKTFGIIALTTFCCLSSVGWGMDKLVPVHPEDHQASTSHAAPCAQAPAISDEEWGRFNAVFGKWVPDKVTLYRTLYQRTTTLKFPKLKKEYPKILEHLAHSVSFFEGMQNDLLNERHHNPNIDWPRLHQAFAVLQKSFDGFMAIHHKMLNIELSEIASLAYNNPHTFIQVPAQRTDTSTSRTLHAYLYYLK